MRITLTAADGTTFADITVNPSTLESVDETGDVVVLFPAPGERDMTTLRQLIEEACHDEACQPTGRVLSDLRDVLACGSVANPAGYCCEHGTYVRAQTCTRCGKRHCGGTDAHDRALAPTPEELAAQECEPYNRESGAQR